MTHNNCRTGQRGQIPLHCLDVGSDGCEGQLAGDDVKAPLLKVLDNLGPDRAVAECAEYQKNARLVLMVVLFHGFLDATAALSPSSPVGLLVGSRITMVSKFGDKTADLR